MFITWCLCSIPGGGAQYIVVVQYPVVVFNTWFLYSICGGCVQYLVVVVVVELVMVELVGSMAGQSLSSEA